MTTLDVASLPFERVYTCTDGTTIDLAEIVDQLNAGVNTLALMGLIKDNESFGFAMTEPVIGDDNSVEANWDEPNQFVWFVGGWGPNRDQYIANAARKLRPMLREEVDSSLELRFAWLEAFQDVVDSINGDGTFSWGDFPWGGAVTIYIGPLVIKGAISCLKEIEDDAVARLLLILIGQRIALGNKLLDD